MRERESAQLTFADSVVAHLGGRRTRATLDQLDQSIDWEALATPVRRLYHNDHGGNPAGPVVMMLKILLLQKWFNLSDPQAEEQINDRLSFRRFVGLGAQESAPDETTIVKFRDRLRRGGVEAELFEIVARSIEERGLLVREGTLVDALILEAPTGRKTGRGRAAEPKARAASGDGAATDEAVDSSRSTQPEPREGKPSQRDAEPKTRDAKPGTRDREASFTRKHGRTYHGYKGHIAADRSGIVTGFDFSTASEHDSRYIDRLTERETRAVIADAAYADRSRRDRLRRRGVLAGIAFKRNRGQRRLSPLLRRINRVIASIRATVEHTMARLRKWGLSRTRYRGLERNRSDFVMGLVAHNVRRAMWLAS